MMNKKVLHICYLDKFIPDFVSLVRNNVKTNNHTFITMGSNFEKYPIPKSDDLVYLKRKYLRYYKIVREMYKNDNIMIHGLFDPGIIILLYFQPWLLSRCYWVMWGGDIYSKPKTGVIGEVLEFFKNKVAKNMGFLVTYIEGDVEHVRKKYSAKGEYKYCIMYPSNCYKESNIGSYDGSNKHSVKIQVGNSADPENKHEFALSQLKKSNINNGKIYCPLSYGAPDYAKKIIDFGKLHFGEDFVPMTSFMSLSEYTKWQSSLDIGVFAHNRQQGMGNIITLLGLGKTVYLKGSVSSAKELKKLGLKVGNIDKDIIAPFSEEVAKNNIAIVKDTFSKDKLISQIEGLFFS